MRSGRSAPSGPAGPFECRLRRLFKGPPAHFVLAALLLGVSPLCAQIDWGAVASLRVGTDEVQALDLPGLGRVWERPNPLPYDAEVEYIESTGTQYIDTGITSARGWFAADLTATATSGAQRYDMFFGTAAGSSGSDRLVAYNDAQKYEKFTLYRGASYAKAGVAYPTLTLAKTAYSISSARTIYIFHSPAYPNNDGRCRLRSFKLWNASGALVRDFIPVRVGAAGFLYDRVSETLYGNDGTGAFGVGPDKAP